MNAARSVRFGVLCALASAALFGASVPIAKTLLGSMSPLALAGCLYAGAGLGLALVLAARRAFAPSADPIAWPRRAEAAWLASAIALGGIAGPIALMFGLAATAASTAALLLNLEAVFTALVAWLAFREHIGGRIAAGLLAIVAGGVVLASTPPGGGSGAGAWLVTLACLCWALDNNLTRRVSGSDAVVIAMLKGCVAGSVNVGLALAMGDELPRAAVALGAALVGFAGYGVSLVLFVVALRHLGAARAGACFSVAPFFGAAIAVGLQGDPMTASLAAGGALMAVGVWLHVTERHSHVHVHERGEHEHGHVHDDHHRHEHGSDWDGREPHVHPHVHVRLVHAHPHAPDVHHRHPH